MPHRKDDESHVPHADVLLCPHAPEALVAHRVEVIRPVRPTRTDLLLVSKHARILSFLREPGATIWLIGPTHAWQQWDMEGTGTGYDVYSRALPIGVVHEPPHHLCSALAHVGYHES